MFLSFHEPIAILTRDYDNVPRTHGDTVIPENIILNFWTGPEGACHQIEFMISHSSFLFSVCLCVCVCVYACMCECVCVTERKFTPFKQFLG